MSDYQTKRNEFIADMVARLFVSPESPSLATCVHRSINLADAIESNGFAPWQTSPALPDAARRVVEAAVAAYDDAHDMNVRGKLWDAVLAYKESVK